MLKSRFLFGSRSIKLVRSVSGSTTSAQWESFILKTPYENVLHVEINRPDDKNAMNKLFWSETKKLFYCIKDDPSVRSVVISGAGTGFSSGLELLDFGGVFLDCMKGDAARSSFRIHNMIRNLQSSFNSIEKCRKPVIGAIHGYCLGGAIGMACAADIRYCSKDAWFEIKELKLGIAADLGTLQRLPKLVGSDSLARELIYTGRRFEADEAFKCGFVRFCATVTVGLRQENMLESTFEIIPFKLPCTLSRYSENVAFGSGYQWCLKNRVFDSHEELLKGAIETAKLIASHSPVAIRTSKAAVLFSRDNGVMAGLKHMADMNQVMLQSQDVQTGLKAAIREHEPEFEDS